MPSVSVIVPTYNRGPLVEEAVASVLNQTFDDLELLVVVDGSPDDTAARLTKIRDPRLKVIVQDNAGLSAARNAAMRQASGEFIALLDDDDVWLPHKLEAQTALLHAFPDSPYVFSEFLIWYPGESETPGGLRRWFEKGWFELDETAGRMLDSNDPGTPLPGSVPRHTGSFRLWRGSLYHSLMVGALVLPSTAVFRHAVLPERSEVFPVEDVYCGDWTLFAELSRSGPALFMDEPTVRNRSHHDVGRLTQGPQVRKMATELDMLERIWGSDQEFLAQNRARYEQRLKATLLRLAKAQVRAGEMAGARDAVNQARRLPGRLQGQDLILGGMLALPGLDYAIRLLDLTRTRWRSRTTPS